MISGKGFDEERRLFSVLSICLFLTSRNVDFIFQKRRGGGTIPNKNARRTQLVREEPPVKEAPRRVRDTGTRANGKRTLSTGWRQPSRAPYMNRSFEYSVSN